MTFPEKKESDRGIFTAVMDLDNTLAEDTWPDNVIGEPIERGIEILLHLREQGNEIVIYTARPESHKPAIWAWLAAQGLGKVVYDVVCGKPRGWVLIDDRAWNPFTEEPQLAGHHLAWVPDDDWPAGTIAPDPVEEGDEEPAQLQDRHERSSHAVKVGRAKPGSTPPAPGKPDDYGNEDRWEVMG